MANAALTTLYDAVCAKLKRARLKHQKYVSTLNEIDAKYFSIDYTVIPLPKECRHVKLWYSRDAITAYKQILRIWREFNEDDQMKLKAFVDEFEVYVIGWDRGREVTEHNLMTLRTTVKERLARIADMDRRLTKAIDGFNRINRDSTELVDQCVIPLYHNTDNFNYHRAYAHFFRRVQIQEGRLQRILEEDLALVDRLLELAAVLYRGYDRVGRDEAFENYRRIQRELLVMTEQYDAVIESHMELLQSFAAVRQLVIYFKIYPYDKEAATAGQFHYRRR